MRIVVDTARLSRVAVSGRDDRGTAVSEVGRCLLLGVCGAVIWVLSLVGLFGGVARADAPLAWKTVHLDAGNYLQGVSCPSTSLCVGVDSAGNVVTSTSPTAGAGAWTVAPVHPVSSGGAPGQTGLFAVSCPSRSLCVAVGANGTVATSANPTGGSTAWIAGQVVNSSNLHSVSCPSTSLCVAVDDLGDIVTSSDPAGGAGTWTATYLDIPQEIHAPINAVSCPSTSLCVAVYFDGPVVSSTDPAAGAAAWTPTGASIPGASMPGSYITSLACPSTGLCVVVGSAITTSTNPTGGPGAWTTAYSDQDAVLWGLSCPATSFCVADDASGNVLTSTDPTGGGAAWELTAANQDDSVTGLSCPSTSLCVGVSYGTVVVGTPGTSEGTGSGGSSHATSGVVALAASKAIVAANGHARLTLTCSRKGPCRGRYAIEVTGAQAPRSTRRRKAIVLARGSYSIIAGSKRRIAIRLSRNGLVLVRNHHGHLFATLTLSPDHGRSTKRTLTLTLAPRASVDQRTRTVNPQIALNAVIAVAAVLRPGGAWWPSRG